jgi:hypothetical protein
MALTDIAIRNAKPREKEYKLVDGGGLYLLVTPAGGRLWRLKYRVDGIERKLAIGTLADARKARDAVPRPQTRHASPRPPLAPQSLVLRLDRPAQPQEA